MDGCVVLLRTVLTGLVLIVYSTCGHSIASTEEQNTEYTQTTSGDHEHSPLGNIFPNLTEESFYRETEHVLSSSSREGSHQPGHQRYKQCPSKCDCAFSSESPGMYVNCSRRTLTTVPGGFPETSRVLNLKGNLLSTIPNFAFLTLKHLRTLDLSDNEIASLHNCSFWGLYNLETLFLSGNKLRYKHSYAPNVFRQLRSLRVLQIQKNCDDSTRRGSDLCSYPDHALSYVRTLETLIMDGLRNQNLGEGFRYLKKLRRLSMNGKETYCKLYTVTNATFNNLHGPTLEYLDISHCGVWFISNDSLDSLTALKTLDLENNRHLCTSGLRNVTTTLRRTDIKQLFLKLTCIHPLFFLDSDVFEPLSSTTLRLLDLQHLHLAYLSQEMIASLPSTLESFSFHHNSINDAGFLERLVFMPNLERLDSSEQNHYSSNDVKMTPKGNITIHWQGVIPLPPKLRFINASYIKLSEYCIPEINFSHNNVLEIIDVSHDYFTNISGIITGLKYLKQLHLDHNLIEYSVPYAFSKMPSLELLNLSGNLIGSNIDLSAQSFSTLSTLEILDLSENKIKRLPINIFRSLVSLKILHLDNNALNVIKVDLETMSNLSLLTLQQNQLVYIDATLLRTIDQIGHGHELSLALSRNLFKCDCQDEQREFIRWLSETRINIVDRYKTYCVLNNDSMAVLTTQNTTEIVSQLSMTCIWIEVVVCSVSFFLLLNLVLGFIAAMYKQRWKLRYLYYTGRQKVNPYHPLEEETVILETDVYMSFDEDYVFSDGQELYRVLSTDLYSSLQGYGLSVKIRHELLGGQMLHDVISSSIRHSRKVLAFISKEYCREFWNTFEFNMAAYDGLYTKRNVVIPIIVGEVEPNDLLPEIRAFLANKPLFKVDSAETLMQMVEILVSKIQAK